MNNNLHPIFQDLLKPFAGEEIQQSHAYGRKYLHKPTGKTVLLSQTYGKPGEFVYDVHENYCESFRAKHDDLVCVLNPVK